MPRTRLGEALREIERMSAEPGIRVANVFHAGDGNLHPLILFDGREPGASSAPRSSPPRSCAVRRLGGSITGEHGVGVEKRDYLKLMFSADDLALMERLRAAVDPARLANRGKMLIPPGGASRERRWSPAIAAEVQEAVREGGPLVAGRRAGRSAATLPAMDGPARAARRLRRCAASSTTTRPS